MPFAEMRLIDVRCGATGDASSSAKKASNRAKNNFSAPGPAIPLTFADFAQLQQKIDDDPTHFTPSGDDGYDVADRSRLKDFVAITVDGVTTRVGEGKRVVLKGVVMNARHANSWPLDGTGENVNCHSSSMSNNDIHIELAETSQDLDAPERRVTAEISPHFRPMMWERFDTDDRTAPHVDEIVDLLGSKRLAGKPGIKELIGQRVRIYGHLYFDDVHRPCRCHPCNRLSTWEVHPVYSIDVEEGGEWVPFHEWASKR